MKRIQSTFFDWHDIGKVIHYYFIYTYYKVNRQEYVSPDGKQIRPMDVYNTMGITNALLTFPPTTTESQHNLKAVLFHCDLPQGFSLFLYIFCCALPK